MVKPAMAGAGSSLIPSDKAPPPPCPSSARAWIPQQLRLWILRTRVQAALRCALEASPKHKTLNPEGLDFSPVV